jgi:hypothetical protein
MKKQIKTIIFTILLAIAIIVSCISAQKYLSKTSAEMRANLDNLQHYISQSDWENADMESKKLQKNWDSIKKRWAVLIDHQEVDNVELSIVRVRSHIDVKNFSLALTEVSVLIQAVDNIPETEKPTLGNIF